MGLGSVVRHVQSDGTLKRIIEASYKEVRVVPPPTSTSYMRASRLGEMCPREEVLCSKLQVTREDKYSATSMLTFAHGKGLHHILQNDVLPAAGVLLGQWSCLDCGRKFGTKEGFPDGIVPRPKACDGTAGCGGREFQYRELRFVDEQLRIGGHPDGFLCLPGMPGIGLLEAKSIGKGWEVRQAPNMSHVIQVHVYLMFTGLQWARILYWEKGASGVDALIEHHIDRDNETISRIREVIRSVWEGIAGTSLPDRICTKDACPRAMKCVVSKPCFETAGPMA